MAQQVNMPAALPSVPGFSEQQVHELINIIHSVMQQYFAPSNQPPQYQPPSAPAPSNPPTPPAPQETQKEKDIQLLQQATVESTTESTTKHCSSVPDSKSTISTIPRLCTARSFGDLAAYDNALLLAYLFGYIRHSEGLKATGQG